MQSGTDAERACPPLMDYLEAGISRNDEIALISYGILSNPLLIDSKLSRHCSLDALCD